MTEQVRNKYKRLFEIHLLHHYWLDEGADLFDLIKPVEKKNNRLKSYDRRSFLELKPAASTERMLSGLGGIYKDTALGCIVAVPEDAVIPADTMFEFIVVVKDRAFFNYTSLTLPPQKIYEFYYKAKDTIYRYKENVPVLSNLTGASREMGEGDEKEILLFLSRDIPELTKDDKIESLIRSGDELRQLISDPLNETPPDLNKLSQLIALKSSEIPVFVHQADIPNIEPPEDLAGVPERGIFLPDDMDDRVFALIRLTSKEEKDEEEEDEGGEEEGGEEEEKEEEDDDDFNFIKKGKPKTPCPIFQIRFKNRSTFWQYKDKNTGAPKLPEPAPEPLSLFMSLLSALFDGDSESSSETESGPLPLTYYGNAGTRQKPSEGVIKPKKEKKNVIITRLVSEIFV